MGHKVEIIEGVAVLVLTGEFWGGDETQLVFDAVKEHLAAGTRRFVIDLGKTDHLNSRAIGLLMTLHTTVRRQGGRFVLARVGKRIKNVLVVTKLVFVFDTYESREEAITSILGWTPEPPSADV
jgi:anti-sigma B factor antagonist